MKYLQALEIIEKNLYKKTETLNIKTSFFSEVLNIFLKGYFLKKKIKIKIRNNNFNTLTQALLDKQKKGMNLVILTPWDFCGQLNFREGTQNNTNYFSELKNDITEFVSLIKKNKNHKIIYCDFPYPNILINENENKKLKNFIKLNAFKISNLVIKRDYFDIDRFIDIGFPILTEKLSNFAKKAVEILYSKKKKFRKANLDKIINDINFEKFSKKIIATDFDGVLWKGIISDDGYKNIDCKNNSLGFKHFLYQKLLLKLKKQGILLIGVTRNNYQDALSAFKNKSLVLKRGDFVKILANYKKKSENIRLACEELNMSISNVLFVDDNLIEIDDVKKNLPEVKSLIFPKKSEEFLNFLNSISSNFQKNYITKEDLNRVSNYQKNKNIKIKVKKGSEYNIDKFLNTLKMKLKVVRKKLSNKDLERPFQLINKTNQFNINGERLSEKQFKKTLKTKGSLFSAFYKDKTGEYGEVITLLADNKKNVISFVMSCRVFQRKIELEFLRLLITSGFKINKFAFKKTKKNEPFRIFYKDFLSSHIDPYSKKFNNENFVKNLSFEKKIFNSQIRI